MRLSIGAFALAGIVVAGCTAKSSNVPSQELSLELPVGSSVSLVLMQNLVAGKTPEGADVTLMVASDVRDSSGHILIPRGELATGKVVWSRGQDTLDALSNRPPRLTISIDGTKTADGQAASLSAGPSGSTGEPYAFTRDNTGKQLDQAKLEALMKDPATAEVLKRVSQMFAEGDTRPAWDSSDSAAAMRKIAADLDLPETQKALNGGGLDQVRSLMTDLKKGGAVAALASGGGATALAVAGELAGVAGEVGNKLGRIVKGKTIKAYLGTSIEAHTTAPVTVRLVVLPQ